MLEAVPDIKSAANPNLEWPRLRCYFFFPSEGPTKSNEIWAQSWCIPKLRELYYDVDKECSRKASRLALPQLMNEINVIREPRQAVQRFKIMALNPDLFRMFMEKVKEENAEALVDVEL